jgi:hypothetical protein
MHNKTRESVVKRVHKNHETWSNIIAATYALIIKDRIGSFGATERSGVPGLCELVLENRTGC